jgi:hypothetical protein
MGIGRAAGLGPAALQIEAALASIAAYLQPALSPYLLAAVGATLAVPEINRSIYSPQLQRQTAWALLALAVAEALTSFAAGPVTSNLISTATGGLLTRGVGLQLHLLLIDPLAFFFVLHIASGVGLALIRRGVTWRPLYSAVIPALLIAGSAAAVNLDSLFFLA